MHRNEYRRMAHEEVEEIFREILPQAGMKVREEQITLCHQMLSSLCGNKIALCDAAVGVGKTYAYLVACILFRKYSQLLSGYFSMCGQSQPIVISTSSIALQEAIQREYIPFLSQVLLKKGIISAPIQAVIRKGKEHFVCDNRLELRLDAVRRKAKNPLQREALYALRERSMFKMWWKIAKLAGLFFLGFGAAQDIKYQKISTEYLLAGSCAAILYRALFGRMHWSVWVAGLGCGIVFLMISKWSQEGIGYGDSWMILNMGIFLGIWNLLGMLMLAFLVAAMAAGAGLWSGKWKRTTRMSFYPFLLIGYLGTFIW